MNIRSIYKVSVHMIFGLIIWVGISSCDSKNSAPKFIDLQIHATTDNNVDVEISGLVQSRKHENVFWMHGDSGDDNVIFPVTKDGNSITDTFKNGIELFRVKNEDWEDIALDDSGNLYVGDIGNNCLCRNDLMILQFPEPNLESSVVDQIKKIRFNYPADTAAVGEPITPDAEALFYLNGNLYILTKESKGVDTKLYELANPDPSRIHELHLLQSINFDDKVTAADISNDEKTIAILTSSSVWLLKDFSGNEFFSGTINKVFFKANQVESIAFTSDESLLIAEETGELYEIDLSEFD